MSPKLYLAFVASSVFVIALPGPTNLFVVSHALAKGSRSAMGCILGVGLGDAVAATVSALGLGAILATSAFAFGIFKWIAALYLLWLGVKMWRESPFDAQGVSETASSGIGAGVKAFAITALNPKVIVFFMAFLPNFVVKSAPLVPQLALLIATFVAIGVLVSAVYALAGHSLGTFLHSPSRLQLFNRTGGGFMIGAAALTATMNP
ncbi:LysE family translocator [Roseibium sp. RKSG952]|uniref:LysE family translocator n=1 Tax=Roseibium sp. RKSG952 TaxID=2529384 RepID=UPI0012BD0ED4|nr:LysE family translocator [Roseibium sp. RKSG952]MTH97230.1 LysE family translocator [Roseibium sp. RKSG952]